MAGSYADGYGAAPSPSRGYGTNGDNRRGYASSRSRERGYGGYDGVQSESLAPAEAADTNGRRTGRPTDLERKKARRKSDTSTRSRSRARGPQAEKQIEEVLDYTKQDWAFMTEKECIPAYTSLQLLDTSSLGLANRYEEFHDASQQLQGALRAIVNEHYQGFNSSIGIYHQINASIQSSHNRIRDLRQALVDSKTSLTSTKSEFSSMIETSREFDGHLDVLNTVEQVQALPETLEARMSEKRFIPAVESLQEGLRLLQQSQLESVTTLTDMKVYMNNQEHALSDILVEELHNHLYLKSPYCENRWTSYAKLYGERDDVAKAQPGTREVYDFLDRLDMSEPFTDESSRNPELDSFQYIRTLVESLYKLGRMESAVEAIEERLPVELYRVLERTSAEIQQRHPSAGREHWKNTDQGFGISMDQATRNGILSDLLGTLYGRFEAIAESYRAFYEVTEGICRRDDTYDPARMTRSFRELWKLYQSEIRSLLHDYLSTDSSSQRVGQGLASDDNVFRQQRDRSKKTTFKMDWLESGNSELKDERDEMNALWQKQVPGLSQLDSSTSAENTAMSSGNGDASSTGHKLLVEPSVFNVMCLLPPSVIFLKRLKELVPPSSDIVISTLSSFLNDFLINVFHPQLEETLTDESSQSFLQLDAFQVDLQWSRHAQRPIFKGTAKIFEIISSFCKMLVTLTHDQLFSQLVITQLNNYYDKCCSWYKALVTRAQAKPDGRDIKAAASCAREGEISDLVSQIWERGTNMEHNLVEQETTQLLRAMSNEPLDEADLIMDRKAQASLCVMYTSMKWLASRIARLRYISPKATDQTGMEDEEEKPQLKRSLTSALINDRPEDGSTPTYLPLSERTASLFDGVIEGFEELADIVLRTLHLELRCHIAQSLGASFKGSLLYSDPAEAPDEDITKLLSDLLAFNQEVQSHLPEQEHKFITHGIGPLADSFFVHSAVSNITSMNANGCSHMVLNVQVLHHSLLHIEPGCRLPRANALFALFGQGPDAIVAAAREGQGDEQGGFRAKEYEALLRLWYSEKTEGESREEAGRAQRTLGEKLSLLGEVG